MTQPAFDFGEEFDDAANPTYTVSELADAVNQALRREFSDGVWVRGEIQGWNERGGHAYFSLCDDSPGRHAVVRVQFFAPARNRLRPMLAKHRLRLTDGMKVRIFGHLDFYAPSGQLGLKMADLDPRFTLGDLAQQRDQVLRRLAADGSLDANRRHRLGAVPLRLGVVASPGTAAWHDFHDELQRSGFGFQVVLAGTRVQGPDAPRLISRAVTALSHHARRHGLDAIVLIRGGGARNELATFDAEVIARAIVASPVPVLTGLGHEIDRSVADEVAHTSLKTPTACAAALVQAVAAYVMAVERAFVAVGAAARTRLTRAEGALDERARRFAGRTHAAVERAGERLDARVHRLRTCAHRPIDEGSRHLSRLTARVTSRTPQLLGAEERHLAGIEARVRALDPVNVLSAGMDDHPLGRGCDRTVARRGEGRRRDPDPVRCRHGEQPRRGCRRRPKGATVTPESAAAAAADQPGYAQALDELDQILRELEGTDVDVDRLADRVARATELIAVCRQRITAAKLRIDEVIADLDGSSDDDDDER